VAEPDPDARLEGIAVDHAQYIGAVTAERTAPCSALAGPLAGLARYVYCPPLWRASQVPPVSPATKRRGREQHGAAAQRQGRGPS
jgi:hypothetical protein